MLWGLIMLQFVSLLSGSSGNAAYISDGKTRILVDCGASGKKISGALNEIGVAPESIDAMLITHEHSDHIQGAGIMARRYKLPIYATAHTHREMKIGAVGEEMIKEVSPDKAFEIGTIGIMPFKIPHDAAMPVGYTFSDGHEKAALATDIGCMSDYILSHLYGSKKIILESNHDVEMLRMGAYPYPLKQRILSDIGHLSNKAAAQTALELINHGTEQLMLGHLSIQNNLPEIAVMETYNLLTASGVKVGFDVTLQVADRYKVTQFEKMPQKKESV